MKKVMIIAFLSLLISSCNTNDKTNDTIGTHKQKETTMNDTIPKVTGIGGIFFYADNPKETKEWYSKNLGIEINEWGSASFESRNIDRPDEMSSLQWKPFKKGDEYFSPSPKDFMINYQVQNIEGLVIKLQENGVTILDSIATYDYGKFVHIMDLEGNKIELWEPK
jgi:predicted enzyme related to lactoylglutathione lyase